MLLMICKAKFLLSSFSFYDLRIEWIFMESNDSFCISLLFCLSKRKSLLNYDEILLFFKMLICWFISLEILSHLSKYYFKNSFDCYSFLDNCFIIIFIALTNKEFLLNSLKKILSKHFLLSFFKCINFEYSIYLFINETNPNCKFF